MSFEIPLHIYLLTVILYVYSIVTKDNDELNFRALFHLQVVVKIYIYFTLYTFI